MKNIFKILLAVISLLVLFTLTNHRAVAIDTTPDDAAKKYNITFPIADLGNCADITACRAYCENPENRTACLEFAKKKGFDKPKTANNETLTAAKQALGCDSIETCKQLCQLPENRERCEKFAKERRLVKEHPNPSSLQVLEKAKTALGCTSVETCKAICQQEANRQKCSEFARLSNLRGGLEKRLSEECLKNPQACLEKCREHPENCPKNATEGARNFTKPPFSPPPNFKNQGCPNPTACYEQCKKDPSKCTNLKPKLQEGNSGSNNLFRFFQSQSPKPQTETELENESEDQSVKGAKTGPLDFVNSIVNFFSSIF